MGLFRKTRGPINYNDPLMDDSAWLSAGEQRYSQLISNHYGSPDTIAAGGDLRMNQNDPASALFFFQKSIDTMHSIYVCGFHDTGPSSWSRQPSPRDGSILERYLHTLQSVRTARCGAPITASVKEVTHRVRTISSQFRQYSLPVEAWLSTLSALERIAPEIDVSDVFWN